MSKEAAVYSGSLENRPGFNQVIEIFGQQSANPPGCDQSIGSCYKAVLSLASSDRQLGRFLEDVYNRRVSITPVHFVNLFFRSVQYVQLYLSGDSSYQEYNSKEQWEPVLLDMISSPNGAVLEELLLTRETVTTKYQRYAGPKALLAALWPSKSLNVADFGCGANYGLRGLELNEPFEQIIDNTPDHRFLRLMEIPIVLNEGLAVDKQNPEAPEIKAWSVACSYCPQEFSKFDATDRLEKRLKLAKKTVFLHADLLEPVTLEMIPRGHFHAVVLSTVLYQHLPWERDAILAEAQKVLNPEGVIIIQDFARKNGHDTSGLAFSEPWFNNYGYRTFLVQADRLDQPLEVFQWSDGRCTQVRSGLDYSRIFASNSYNKS